MKIISFLLLIAVALSKKSRTQKKQVIAFDSGNATPVV